MVPAGEDGLMLPAITICNSDVIEVKKNKYENISKTLAKSRVDAPDDDMQGTPEQMQGNVSKEELRLVNWTDYYTVNAISAKAFFWYRDLDVPGNDLSSYEPKAVFTRCVNA